MTCRLSTLLLAGTPVSLAGCSYSCKFEARGVIREAATGQPIPQAQVEFVNEKGHKLADPIATNLQGEFQVNFKTVPSPSLRDPLTGWKIVLKAEGFEPETIDVGPVVEPKRADVTVYLVFHGAMRNTR